MGENLKNLMRSVSDWGTHKCLIIWLQVVFVYIHFSFRTGERIRMEGVTKKKRGRPAKAKTIGLFGTIFLYFLQNLATFF